MKTIDTIKQGWRRVWSERRGEESLKLPLALLLAMAASGILIGAATGTAGLIGAGAMSGAIALAGLYLHGRLP